MPDRISEAVDAALKSMESTQDLSSVERALNIAKLAAEIKKAEADRLKLEQDARKISIDAQLSAGQTLNASRTALAALLVPAASFLTVVATLIAASWQIWSSNERSLKEAQLARQAAKEAREEADWGAFEAILDKDTADRLYASPTFTARLRSFATTGRYDQQLLDITKKFMIQLSSPSAFQDIWKIAFKEAGDGNIDSVVEMARLKSDREIPNKCKAWSGRLNFKNMPTDPWSEWGICSSVVTHDDLVNQIKDPKDQDEGWKLHQALANDGSFKFFLSDQIAGYLRRKSNKATGPRILDLSNVYLLWANFENVDFSGVNLTGTTFDRASLKGAILRPKDTAPAAVYFLGVPWWEAEAIDLPLLIPMVVNAYPGKGILPYGYDIAYDEYVNKVQALCQNKLQICAKKCLRYKTMPFQNSPECQSTIQ